MRRRWRTALPLSKAQVAFCLTERCGAQDWACMSQCQWRSSNATQMSHPKVCDCVLLGENFNPVCPSPATSHPCSGKGLPGIPNARHSQPIDKNLLRSSELNNLFPRPCTFPSPPCPGSHLKRHKIIIAAVRAMRDKLYPMV